MNMRSLAVILGALVVIPVAACTVTTSGGTGGSGSTSTATGAGGGSTSTSTATGTGGGGVGGGTSTGTSTSASTGTGMCDMMYTCADAIDPMTGDPSKLCDGTAAAMAYDDLAKCTCMGNCAAKCGDNTCKSMPITAECKTCLGDADANGGCGTEFTACANN